MSVGQPHRHAPPRASVLLEALRGLGYSTGAALADIIDNSIAAGATRVDLTFAWHGTGSFISILDDGAGMDESELDIAMRLGEKGPGDARHAADLGRFGLGLKTASFSQCRRLTVASRKAGATHCLRWDLDVLAASRDAGWLLLSGPATGSLERLSALSELQGGTLVLWEVLDRIVSADFTEQNFLDLVDRVEKHLAMVFHRYLAGKRPRLTLRINGRRVSPWDPFLESHSFTWSSPVEVIRTRSGPVEVQCYVLPHRDRLPPREYELAGGPDGWTAQQGFYVYRNERLLVAGSWLGLGSGRTWTKEEAHRLARIRLDITNASDEEWKIDIRKAIARPPVSLRPRLAVLAEDVRKRARSVFAHRGQIIRQTGRDERAEGWLARESRHGVRYRINEDHPAMRAVLDELGNQGDLVRAMFRVIEETVPIQRIWLDTAEGREMPVSGHASETRDEVRKVLAVMYRNLVLRRGLSPELARSRLLASDPFHEHPDLVAALPDDVSEET